MNKRLMDLRPKELTQEDWDKTWSSASYALEPLAAMLREWIAAREKVKIEDFNVANHYALLAYQAGQIDAIQKVLDILPVLKDE